MKILVKNEAPETLTLKTFAVEDGKKSSSKAEKKSLSPNSELTVEVTADTHHEFSDATKVYVKNEEEDGGKHLKIAVYERDEDGKKNVTNQMILEPQQDKHFELHSGKDFELHEYTPVAEAVETAKAESEYSGTDPKAAAAS